MQRKILIWTIAVVMVIFLGASGYFVYQYFVMSQNEQVVTVGPSPTPPAPIKTPTPTPTPEPTSTPRPVEDTVFDDRVTINIKGDDYIKPNDEKPIKEQLDVAQLWYGVTVEDTGFSNGFIVIDSDNIDAQIKTNNIVYCKCKDDYFNMNITELDAIKTVIEDEIQNLCLRYCLVEYGEIGFPEIPKDAPFELDVGITNYKDYFENTDIIDVDPTINDGVQIVANYTDECSYGTVRYVCFYNRASRLFNSYAWVTCDRDRILYITVTGDVYRKCWSYIIEATNDCIKLIK